LPLTPFLPLLLIPSVSGLGNRRLIKAVIEPVTPFINLVPPGKERKKRRKMLHTFFEKGFFLPEYKTHKDKVVAKVVHTTKPLRISFVSFRLGNDP
jgi:hypothetical protein